MTTGSLGVLSRSTKIGTIRRVGGLQKVRKGGAEKDRGGGKLFLGARKKGKKCDRAGAIQNVHLPFSNLCPPSRR